MKSLGNVMTEAFKKPTSVPRRMATALLFSWLCRITAMGSVLILCVLLYTILSRGMSHLSWSFLTSSPHPDPHRAGIWPALMGTFWTCAACAVFTLPIGIGTAIFLEELRPKNLWMRWLHSAVQLNIANLAGVPSVVYGIVGMAAFVSMFGLMDRADKEQQGRQSIFEIGSRYFDQFLTIDDSVLLVAVESNATADTVPQDGLAAIDLNGRPVKMRLIQKGEAPPSSEAERAVSVRWNETPGVFIVKLGIILRFRSDMAC